jgi:hypothetical protein
MTILDLQAIQQEQIKLRWKEPYVSAALNNKTYTTLPRGIYRGFEITPGPGTYEITIDTATPTGIVDYEQGAFDSAVAMGYSVAVHENLSGHSANIIMLNGVNSNYNFDLTAYQGSEVFAAIDVQYALNFPTTAQVKIVDAAELDADPSLLVIGKIEVPSGSAITGANIIYDDTNYPRILPFANELKDGFMTKEYASILESLTAVGASNAFEEEYIVSSDIVPQIILIPGGQQYVVNGFDLWIYKNGVRMTRGRDYNEVDDGLGWGTTVEWIGPLQLNDRILFRGQQYAVALTNTLVVLDEAVEIQQNVTRMNFVGSGVLALPDGPGRVRVVIPSAAASSSAKNKFNDSGTTIPRGRAVHLLSDGSIVPCDPTDPGHKPFGITSVDIPNGDYGLVFLGGVALNTLIGATGFTTGQDVFVAHDGIGTLVPIPPDPLTGSVFRMGIADCADGTSEATPTDVVLAIERMI